MTNLSLLDKAYNTSTSSSYKKNGKSNSSVSFSLDLARGSSNTNDKDSYVSSPLPPAYSTTYTNTSPVNTSIISRLNKANEDTENEAEEERKSIDMIIKDAEENGITSTSHNDYPISVDTFTKTINIGGHTKGSSQISVNLSSGYRLEFDRENLDIIVGMLDLFSPEDINRILEAVQLDNITKSSEKEKDDNVDSFWNNAGQQLMQSLENSEKPPLETVEYDKENKSVVFVEKSIGNFPGDTPNDEETETKTTSKIITKPDGSRVLMVTITMGDKTFEKSIKLSDKKDNKELNTENTPNIPDNNIDSENSFIAKASEMAKLLIN